MIKRQNQNLGTLFRTRASEVSENLHSPPSTGTRTSIAAAASLSPEKIDTDRAVVLKAVQDSPAGLTREEIENVTGLSGNTVRPRVNSLIKDGVLAEHGERRTSSNRMASVVIARGA